MADPWLLGIEIGGTKLQLAIGHGTGRFLAMERHAVDPARGAAGIRDQIETAYGSLLAGARLDKAQIAGAGIGFGGPVDGPAGQTLKSFQISGWEHFPLASWVTDTLGIPRVILENDSDAAGFAEACIGAGAGRSPVLYMNVGSGIGGALVVDRRLYRGYGQGAMEIGHLRVPLAASSVSDSPPEVEQVASGWAIAAAARKLARQKGAEGWPVLISAGGVPEQITTMMVAEAASLGDAEASSLLDQARRAVAFALTQAITLLAPKRIVLGGGVSLIREKEWLDPIRCLVDASVFEPFRRTYDIVPAALGEEVVVHGALALAREILVA